MLFDSMLFQTKSGITVYSIEQLTNALRDQLHGNSFILLYDIRSILLKFKGGYLKLHYWRLDTKIDYQPQDQ